MKSLCLLSIFTTRFFPSILSLTLLLVFFWLEMWPLVLISLVVTTLILYLTLREEYSPSWEISKSITLFAFVFLVLLTLLLLLSLLAMRLEWAVVSLFFSCLVLLFLLFAYYFKPYR